MPEAWKREEPVGAPEQVVGKAIQQLAAARLGRAFIPLAFLFVGGIGELVVGGSGGARATALTAGSLATGVAMLAYGLRIVQTALGREPRAWMTLAMLGSLVPPGFALYVLGWQGLRGLGSGSGSTGILTAILFTAMGVWVLRCWMKLVEVERLARVMTLNLDQEGGSA